MIRIFVILFSLVFCLQLIARDASETGEAEKLHRLFADEWQWTLQQYPEWGTYYGDARYNDRLTDDSFDAISERKEHAREVLLKIQAVDRSKLFEQDVISYDLFLRDARIAVQWNDYPIEYMPITQMNGIQLSFANLMQIMPLKTVKDYDNYLKRLRAFPEKVNQTIALMRNGIETGWVQARVGLKSVPAQIAGQITKGAENSPLFTAFKEYPANFTDNQKSQFSDSGRSIIEKKVISAYRKLHDFIQAEYLPACRKNIAASSLPDGKNLYRLTVREYTTTDLSPRQIHELGLQEVARIRSKMESTIKASGFNGTFNEFLHFLRTDPRFYYTNAEDLVTGYRDIAKRADAGLPKLFAELPRLPYGVKAFPDYEAPAQTTARYYEGAADGSRAGYFMVNTYKLETRPKYEMEALSLHEAVPGHHLQISRAQELGALPEFRRSGGYTAFVEGWALYAESLGEAMGFYQDPYSKFGQLTYEMWRACRLVVDTGMHLFGWSRQKAIDYMKANTAKSENDIIVEIDRYIVWPGQALGYKIGELKIKELRRNAEQALGDKFDLRLFHNALLDNGPLPLDILQQQIDNWISAQK